MVFAKNSRNRNNDLMHRFVLVSFGLIFKFRPANQKLTTGLRFRHDNQFVGQIRANFREIEIFRLNLYLRLFCTELFNFMLN